MPVATTLNVISHRTTSVVIMPSSMATAVPAGILRKFPWAP